MSRVSLIFSPPTQSRVRVENWLTKGGKSEARALCFHWLCSAQFGLQGLPVRLPGQARVTRQWGVPGREGDTGPLFIIIFFGWGGITSSCAQG